MTFCQLGRGLSDKEIIERLMMTIAEGMQFPVHFMPEVRLLPKCQDWPRRGIAHG